MSIYKYKRFYPSPTQDLAASIDAESTLWDAVYGKPPIRLPQRLPETQKPRRTFRRTLRGSYEHK